MKAHAVDYHFIQVLNINGVLVLCMKTHRHESGESKKNDVFFEHNSLI